MKNKNLTEENMCRLARALIERFGVSYLEAMKRLEQLRLHIVIGRSTAESPALQAAALTAINAGKRVFLGGVTVQLEGDYPLLLPWSHKSTFSAVIVELGAQLSTSNISGEGVHTLCIGGGVSANHDALEVWVADWRGGVAPANIGFSATGRQDFPLAGVLAAAVGLARGFVQLTGLSTHFVEQPMGISLWRPDLAFDHPDAIGPKLEYLPQRLWLGGLGHLGQAYIWNLSMLSYASPEKNLFMLQDYDRVVSANVGAGLLCEDKSIGTLKTRLCSSWLEARGFQTRIIERRFDETILLQADEPLVAICGFDKIEPRLALSRIPFQFVIDCGIGESCESFDQISLYTFPDSKRNPQQIWGAVAENNVPIDDKLLNAFDQKQVCGVVAETLARKPISTSFVGAFAGACAISEVIRGLHGGIRCEAAAFQLRGNSAPRIAIHSEAAAGRVAFAGCGLVR